MKEAMGSVFRKTNVGDQKRLRWRKDELCFNNEYSVEYNILVLNKQIITAE